LVLLTSLRVAPDGPPPRRAEVGLSVTRTFVTRTFVARRQSVAVTTHGPTAPNSVGACVLMPCPVGLAVGARARPAAGLVGSPGFVAVLEAALYDPEREEGVALLAKYPSQALYVVVIELPVARRRPLGVNEALAFEEADLRDRDVRELVPEEREDLADR